MRIRQSQPIPLPNGSQNAALPRRNQSWRIVSVATSLQNSAVAGNRWMNLVITDGAGNILQTFSGAATPANGNLTTTFVNNGSSLNPGGFNEVAAIPDDLWMQPNWLAVVAISNAQAGDVIQSVNTVYEWYERNTKGAGQEQVPTTV